MTQTTTKQPVSEADRCSLESRLSSAGEALHRDFTALLAAVAPPDTGPQAIAKRLGVDKVLASRLLKAVRAGDPLSVIHRIPGPEPLRRVIRGGAKVGVDPKMLDNARASVADLEALIRDELGDRAALDTIVSAWVPEARREFELRRKQTLFRANADLRGSRVDLMLASVVLAPNPDGEHIDVAWVHGLIGLRRLRPGAPVTIASRRIASEPTARRTTSIDGIPLDDYADTRLPDYCTRPMPEVRAERVGEAVHYRLGDNGYGPASDVSLVLAEVNRAELARYVADPGRRAFVFAEVSTPMRGLCFDLYVHRDLYADQTPELMIHDTSFGGVVNLNDPSREGDRLDLIASIEAMGLGGARVAEVPRYPELIERIVGSLGHERGSIRGYRARLDYPVYGTQISMAFRAQTRSA